ncbi:MAG: hypothetical protein CFE45_44170, partial [Burkholderiales bacterium PBB5]
TGHSLPPERLRQTLLDGLPGTSMPAWRAVLKPAELDAVVAYVTRVLYRPVPGTAIAAQR